MVKKPMMPMPGMGGGMGDMPPAAGGNPFLEMLAKKKAAKKGKKPVKKAKSKKKPAKKAKK